MLIRRWLKDLTRQFFRHISHAKRRRHGSRSHASTSVVEALEMRKLMSVNAVGPEIHVNSLFNGSFEKKAFMEPSGDYTVVWEGGGNFQGQHYAADGTPQGSQFAFERTGANLPLGGGLSDVARDAAGNFILVWVAQAAPFVTGTNIYAELFDSTGNARGDEFAVSGTGTGSWRQAATVSADAAGDFVVAWEEHGAIARRFDSSGTAQGAAFRVNSAPNPAATLPQVVMQPDGDFAVGWLLLDQIGHIEVQRYSKNGTRLGNEIQVNSNASGITLEFSLAMDATGDFVAAFNTQGGGSASGFFAQRYDASGNTKGDSIRVVDSTINVFGPSVGIDATGDFVVGWDVANQSTLNARRFDGSGTPDGDPFKVNTSTIDSQPLASVAMNDEGHFVIAWTAALNQPIFRQDINARLFVSTPALSVARATSPLNYTENDPATKIISSLTLVDRNPGSEILSGATIKITGNYQMGQDRLAFSNRSGINWNWDAATGILTLTGQASLAAYQKMLRSVTYQNVSDNPSPLMRTITFQAFDGTLTSNTVIRQLNVTPVNDAPQLKFVATNPSIVVGGQLAFDEHDHIPLNRGGFFGGRFVVTDADNTTLAGATIQLTTHFIAGQDLLEFTDTANIHGHFDSATGLLNLTGIDTVSHYAAALNSVFYHNLSDNPKFQFKGMDIQLTDGDKTSARYHHTIGFTLVNDPPVISGISQDRLVYKAKSPAVSIAPTIQIADADNLTLIGATITIGSGYKQGRDVLLFLATSKTTGSWDAATGTLTLSGPDTVDNYRTALRSVLFFDSHRPREATAKTILIEVTDGSSSSNIGTRTLLLVR